MHTSKDVLSSDILGAQFGPTEVVVLHQDRRTRIICTRTKGGQQILELSRVAFIPEGVRGFPDTHAAIVTGESMGTAFKSRGVTFTRQTRAAYRHQLPASFNTWFGPGFATVVVVDVFVGDNNLPYAQILETYSPQVVWPVHLGGHIPKYATKIKSLAQFLAQAQSD